MSAEEFAHWIYEGSPFDGSSTPEAVELAIWNRIEEYRNEVLEEVLDLARNRIDSTKEGLPRLALVDFAIMVNHLRTDVPPERVCPECGRTTGHKMDCAKGRMS